MNSLAMRRVPCGQPQSVFVVVVVALLHRNACVQLGIVRIIIIIAITAILIGVSMARQT